MLLELSIRNLAVIEETRLSLGSGLNIITGETGAGKSLLVDALELVMGGRGDREVVRSGEQAVYIEAVFDTNATSSTLKSILNMNGLQQDNESTLILTRETTREGRSSSRINGRTVTGSVMRAVSEQLVDIHEQGSHLTLLNNEFQMRLLDQYGNLDQLSQMAQHDIQRARNAEAALLALDREAQNFEAQRALLSFQLAEVDAAFPVLNEDIVLGEERELLLNIHSIQEACNKAHEILYSAPSNATDLLSLSEQFLSKSPDPSGTITGFLDILTSASAQVEDLAREIRAYADSIESDPKRLDWIDERLDLINQLKRKYGGSIAAVLDFAQKSRKQLEVMETYKERRAVITQELESSYREAGKQAWELSEKRLSAAESLETAIAKELEAVGLEFVEFSCSLTRKDDPDGLPVPDGSRYIFDSLGIDQGEFMICTNPGEGFKPLSQTSSGGETSRLMLAIKSAIQADSLIGTLVFDEIDSGVGGRVGEVVGKKLWDLAKYAQVLCVTHLPQIAAYADKHFHVDKTSVLGRTYAQAVPLQGEARLKELATMLGGSASRKFEVAAEQLLNQATKHKSGTSKNI